MHVKGGITFEKCPYSMVRCDQSDGEPQENLIADIPVVKATPRTLNEEDLLKFKGAKVLLCSTILGEFYKEILGDDVRVLVPDSGASAKREGNTIIVERFFEYN
jgi:hypothetical protein